MHIWSRHNILTIFKGISQTNKPDHRIDVFVFIFQAGGFEIVADFMYEPMYPMNIKIEAVSVLTQATDPWIDLETSLCSLGMHLEKIVVALTSNVPMTF